MAFDLKLTDTRTQGRRGVLHTAHGDVQTPIFMPVGTRATVKTMTPRDLEELPAQIILGNTYHLNLRPGMDIIRQAGGLHKFMNWNHPILTDSGGYQVFSLSKLRKIKAHGVEFQSHIDGSKLFLGPKEAMEIQRTLGSDIAMCFDECTPFPSTHEEAERSLELTLRWAAICREQPRSEGQLVFGINQGGMHRDLREKSMCELRKLDFDGYAIGGLSVGEPEKTMMEVLGWVTPHMPEDKPRYMMGVGLPSQLVRSVARGVDMFDCVLPSRVGRNGSAYTSQGCIPIKAARYKEDFSPIEEGCTCYACQNFTKAYIRHLLNTSEILGLHLMTLHNLHFYLQLMQDIRDHLEAGTFKEFHDEFLGTYKDGR
jgi:queuine tRNA-ribosyltransferase